MLKIMCARERAWEQWEVVIPDRDYATFVAKLQKAKTRKNKDYFVLRATVPKNVANEIGVKPGDYLLFKAKKAQWYHMLNWEKMENTWRMLPDEIRNWVIMDGLYCPGATDQMRPPIEALGSTSPTAPSSALVQQIETYNQPRQ